MIKYPTASERDRHIAELEAAIGRVRELTYASDDGTEYEHDHPAGWGSPECPACWATAIRRALDGTS